MASVYIDKEILCNNYIEVYRIKDEDISNNEILKKVEIKSIQSYKISELRIITENNQYYLFGKSRNGPWFGIKIEKDRLDNYLNKENAELIKFFYQNSSKINKTMENKLCKIRNENE